MAADKEIEISIIYPAYNEAESIPELMEKTGRALAKIGKPAEVIIVDDRSTDGTADIAESLRDMYPYLAVISQPRHVGITRSLSTAFGAASGRFFFFLCADLQADPEKDIPLLYGKFAEGYDVVLGWRQGRKERKVVVSRIYHWVVRLLFGIRFHDMNWIKAFRREVVADMKLRSDWHRYIVVLAAAAGWRITEIKTAYYPRKSGRSKFGVRRVIPGFFDLISVKLHISCFDSPMAFFGVPGFIFLAAAIVLAVVSAFFPGHRALLTILTALSLLASIVLFSSGFLAEMMLSLADDRKGPSACGQGPSFPGGKDEA